MSMQHILCADAFMNNSIEVQGGPLNRINTILNETFQLTVRQQIYEEDEEDEEENMERLRGKLIKQDDNANGSSSPQPFAKARVNNSVVATVGSMGQPLKIKKPHTDTFIRNKGDNNMVNDE